MKRAVPSLPTHYYIKKVTYISNGEPSRYGNFYEHVEGEPELPEYTITAEQINYLTGTTPTSLCHISISIMNNDEGSRVIDMEATAQGYVPSARQDTKLTKQTPNNEIQFTIYPVITTFTSGAGGTATIDFTDETPHAPIKIHFAVNELQTVSIVTN